MSDLSDRDVADLRADIATLVERCGSQTKASRLVGVQLSAFNAYLHGRTRPGHAIAIRVRGALEGVPSARVVSMPVRPTAPERSRTERLVADLSAERDELAARLNEVQRMLNALVPVVESDKRASVRT